MNNHVMREQATAKISGNSSSRINGEIRFNQGRDSVYIEAVVSGLPTENGSGFFGLHIHEGGSCEGAGFSETGNHYSVKGILHPRHAGDLPPLLSMSDGRAYLAVCSDRFRVNEIIGCTVVIHSGADDFRSQPSGNAGSKIACGVVHRA